MCIEYAGKNIKENIAGHCLFIQEIVIELSLCSRNFKVHWQRVNLNSALQRLEVVLWVRLFWCSKETKAEKGKRPLLQAWEGCRRSHDPSEAYKLPIWLLLGLTGGGA